MEFSRLEKNVMDVIKEEQIKLGYRREMIRLYYPLNSLNRCLRTSYQAQEMQRALQEAFEKEQSKLGLVQVSYEAERFCFLIPEDAVVFVHEQMEDKEFIRDFIDKISQHGCSIEQLLEVFHKYSPKVHYERTEHDEFEYLVYFEDGVPDDFRYCITDEGCHMIYHRFTPEDYEDFAFES